MMKMEKERNNFSYPFCSFFINFKGENMKTNEEITNKKQENDEDEDLQRFLRGGFGAK